jgi:2-hydroxy-3-keto-5-methylthiopentenyl-1-phosphate phosphatase
MANLAPKHMQAIPTIEVDQRLNVPLPASERPLAIFCDFDGTITQHDVIVMVMEAFAPPSWQTTTRNIMAGKTTIRDGMAQVFSTIASSNQQAMEALVTHCVHLRAGFADFVQACRLQGMPLVVISGGLDCFIQPVLKRLPAADYAHIQLFCNTADFSQPTMGVLTPHDNPSCSHCKPLPVGCGCCKVSVLDRWSSTQYHRVGIGDGITDLAMAHKVDTLFARDKLALYCDQKGLIYQPFETFFEILYHFAMLGQDAANVREEGQNKGSIPNSIVIPRINGLSNSTEAPKEATRTSQERKHTQRSHAPIKTIEAKHSNNGDGDNAINYGNDYT